MITDFLTVFKSQSSCLRVDCRKLINFGTFGDISLSKQADNADIRVFSVFMEDLLTISSITLYPMIGISSCNVDTRNGIVMSCLSSLQSSNVISTQPSYGISVPLASLSSRLLSPRRSVNG